MEKPFGRGPHNPRSWGTYDHHGYEPLINVRDDPPSRSHHRLVWHFFWVLGSLKKIYINLDLSLRNGQNIKQYKSLFNNHSTSYPPHEAFFLRWSKGKEFQILITTQLLSQNGTYSCIMSKIMNVAIWRLNISSFTVHQAFQIMKINYSLKHVSHIKITIN